MLPEESTFQSQAKPGKENIFYIFFEEFLIFQEMELSSPKLKIFKIFFPKQFSQHFQMTADQVVK